jgi:hypothetical protein
MSKKNSNIFKKYLVNLHIIYIQIIRWYLQNYLQGDSYGEQ